MVSTFVAGPDLIGSSEDGTFQIQIRPDRGAAELTDQGSTRIAQNLLPGHADHRVRPTRRQPGGSTLTRV